MKYLTIEEFAELKKGQELELNNMVGETTAASDMYVDDHGTPVIDVMFNTGPWKGHELVLVRQQIKKKK